MLINRIYPDIFRIKIPLLGPLRYVNSYVVKGAERILIIDPGPYQKSGEIVFRLAMLRLNVNIDKSIFFLTHFHGDHSGMALKLAAISNSEVYISRLEGSRIKELINVNEWIKEISSFALENGFPKDEIDEVLKEHPGVKRGFQKVSELNFLDNQSTINVDGYKFKCIITPGHTPGHICLYEQKKKFLISGDHILEKITPNISAWSYHEDPLNEYLSSIKKMSTLSVNLVLPGHGRIFKDLKKRCLELINHHKQRLFEILSLLKEGSQNAYSIASKIKWDVPYASWKSLPGIQKWFAFGETIAHLNFLVKRNAIEKKLKNDIVTFKLVNDEIIKVFAEIFSREFFQ
ncbi:MAG: MBL fold metallo-hydrolase [Nitrososphaerota archaeon]